MTDSEEPKIIVDEDWKSQVENEKEQLRQQEAQGASRGESPADDDAGIPPASFHVLLATLGTQAMAMMGLLPNPEGGGQTQVHMPMARHLIDMVGVLEEKTKGNLTPEEASMVQENLHQLRMAYVAVSRQTAEADQKDSTEASPGGSIELP
jgi:hypothetical protein